jgi:adenylate kinase family enzyme
MAANSRKMFEQAWLELSEEEQNEIREAAKQTWLAAFNATKLVRAYCPECKGKVQIEFPDTLNQAKTLEILSTLSFGEQPKVVHHEVDHGKLTLEVIGGMSMKELAEIGSFEVDEFGAPILDAEFEEIDPPALPPAA